MCDGSASAAWMASEQWRHASRFNGCVFMMPINGFGAGYAPSDEADVSFIDEPCDMFNQFKTPCLCTMSSATATPTAYRDTMRFLAEKRREPLAAATPWVIGTFCLVAVLLLSVPLIYVCMRRRIAASLDGAAAVANSGTGATLRDATSSAARVRLRVSGALFSLGWSMLVVFFTPIIADTISRPYVSEDFGIEIIIGRIAYWLVPLPPSLLLMLAAILPTDAAAIRCVPFIFVVVFVLLFLFFAAGAVRHLEAVYYYEAGIVVIAYRFWIIMAAWTFQCVNIACMIVLTVPTLRCGAHRMTPRAALQRLWLVARCAITGISVPLICFTISSHLTPGLYEDLSYYYAMAASFFLSGAVATPANRGRVRRLLGALGAQGTSEQEAAAIAALIGRRSPAEALSLADANFRVLPVERIGVDDLVSNADTGMYTRTAAAALGECTAFLSHSWRDDGAAKFGALSRWAERKRTAKPAGGRTDDAAARAPLSIWLDKACIDQHADIDDQLVALPLYLSGCSELLIIAGPTYTSRLWCVVEIFTFVKMHGGDHKDIVLETIGEGANLRGFDGAKATCYLAKDRSHLLGVIESGLGDFRHFNRTVRAIFAAKGVGAALEAGPSKNAAPTLYPRAAPAAEVQTVAIELS